MAKCVCVGGVSAEAISLVDVWLGQHVSRGCLPSGGLNYMWCTLLPAWTTTWTHPSGSAKGGGVDRTTSVCV